VPKIKRETGRSVTFLGVLDVAWAFFDEATVDRMFISEKRPQLASMRINATIIAIRANGERSL
jgi:hypothetical protein